jgi:hypothetical protein
MAKVKIVNRREHAIHLNVVTKDNVTETVTVPSSCENPADRTQVIHGEALVDDSFVVAVKKHPVGQHYFKEGWLRVEGAEKPAPQKPEDKQ